MMSKLEDAYAGSARMRFKLLSGASPPVLETLGHSAGQTAHQRLQDWRSHSRAHGQLLRGLHRLMLRSHLYLDLVRVLAHLREASAPAPARGLDLEVSTASPPFLAAHPVEESSLRVEGDPLSWTRTSRSRRQRGPNGDFRSEAETTRMGPATSAPSVDCRLRTVAAKGRARRSRQA